MFCTLSTPVVPPEAVLAHSLSLIKLWWPHDSCLATSAALRKWSDDWRAETWRRYEKWNGRWVWSGEEVTRTHTQAQCQKVGCAMTHKFTVHKKTFLRLNLSLGMSVGHGNWIIKSWQHNYLVPKQMSKSWLSQPLALLTCAHGLIISLPHLTLGSQSHYLR